MMIDVERIGSSIFFINKQFLWVILQSFVVSSMIKKTEIEALSITDSQTPPNLEHIHASAEPELPTNTQIIRSIISSNEELITQQKMTINQLKDINHEQQMSIKQITEKYESLLQFTKKEIQSNLSSNKEENNSSAGHDPNSDKINIKQMLDKVHQLEQQLTKTKVELALKSQELLTFSLKKNSNSEYNRQSIKPIQSSIDRNSISQYFQPLPYEKYHSVNGNQAINQKQVLELWNKHIDLLNDQAKIDKFRQKTQSLIKKFIPKDLRNKIWFSIVENKLGLTNSLYFHLLERRNQNWVCQKVKKQIDKDIKRSFYGKTQYETKTGLILQVCQFLQIFHVFRPDVSYVQGMTYPAIILIPILGKVKAFQVFCNLILGNPFFRKVFSLVQGFVQVVCRTFELLLSQYLPSVSKKLQKVSIQSQIFLIQWLFTMFSRGLSFQTTLKIWDHVIYHGQLAVFRIALSIFQQLQKQILNLQYEPIIEVIRQYGDTINEEVLQNSFSNHKLNKQKLYSALQKAQSKK